MSFTDWFSRQSFRAVHGNNLVYNACWEDPRLDREALNLGPSDRVVMITSAGCNALDYVLAGAGRVHAVDMNPRQNALLELKLAGIRKLDFESFFDMFGRGRLLDPHHLYRSRLRAELSPSAQQFWDRRIDWFAGRGWRDSFYFRGTSGLFARLVNTYIDRIARVRHGIESLLSASSLQEQRNLYENLRGAFWKERVRWMVGRDASLALVGVPRAQRLQVEKHYIGGVSQFIEDSVEAVFCGLPIADNYFWRVYLTGQYSKSCCPEYLKEENFQRLKGGLADRVSVHTTSLLDFLQVQREPITRFVLLDHMDWLAGSLANVLRCEWQAIVDRAAQGARLIWRSGGLCVDYVDPIEVSVRGSRTRVGELLHYQKDLAQRLHPLDRVHTYGSFYIADLAVA